MLNSALQIVCTSLMAMSVIFIAIELRSRFDKSFLVFGITNLFLAFFCAIDLWIQPEVLTLKWTQIQHSIASFFPVLILWYLMIVLRQINVIVLQIMFIIGISFSILFYTGIMFKPTDKEIVSTMVYNITFAPYIIGAILFIFIYLIVNLTRSTEKDKKVLFLNLIGLSALAGSGIIDMLFIFIGHRFVPGVASVSLLGVLLFGAIVTGVFIDRLSEIIRTREITFRKLQNAYKELEEVQTLKELGQSTAIINHEIQNYAFAIKCNAKYLYDQVPLSEKHKAIVGTIANTAVKMADFSKEILNFSMAKILSEKRQLALFTLIEECVKAHFADKRDMVSIEKGEDALFIHGDWQKLEHVFFNLIKNSFEANAKHISIKALRRDTVLLLVVEDDGIGCTAEQMGSLFKSFYTTKKGKGGTGLGMCVIRSIVESHGGYINAYSKNLLNNDTHGLILIIAFPVYKEIDQVIGVEKDPVVLIKEGVENLAQIIRVFQNVMISPYIVQNVDEINPKELPLEKIAAFASVAGIAKFRKKFGGIGSTHTLVSSSHSVVFVVNEMDDNYLHTFSEKYVLENLR
jgi:signal transduction histidine kinase